MIPQSSPLHPESFMLRIELAVAAGILKGTLSSLVTLDAPDALLKEILHITRGAIADIDTILVPDDPHN